MGEHDPRPPAGPAPRTHQRGAAWVYSGIWSALVEWFRVPDRPPAAPAAAPGERHDTFQPAPGFLGYLKFWFVVVLVVVDIAIVVAWVAILLEKPWLGGVLAIPALLLAVVPDVLVYIGLHLRYDTTWYVLTDRSLRIRRGIWVIHETTITYENIQNVEVKQGPIQRLYGIADVIIETAGAGGSGGSQHAVSNKGLIEGLADAPRVRDLLMDQLRRSRSAGLGDEHEPARARAARWTSAHLDALREVLAEVRALPSG
ncbi:MAG: PH domain-containing protein [Planctomycetota bacterium]|jgi:membrane protein YdbS with pleckstrin-like domain